MRYFHAISLFNIYFIYAVFFKRLVEL